MVDIEYRADMTPEEKKAWKKAYAKQYYQDHKAEIIAASTKYHEEHRDEIAERNRTYQPKYQAANKEKIAEANRQFAIDNPDYQKELACPASGKTRRIS